MGRLKGLDRAAYWRKLFEEHSSIGGTISAFCRERDLSQASFYQWRRKLSADNSAEPADKFVAIDLDAVGRRMGTDEFSIELANGRRLNVPAGFDETSLRRLLAILEERPGC